MASMAKAEPSIFDEPDLEADERAWQEGLADIAAGRVVPNERVIEWLKTWGTSEPKPPPYSWRK
jgi:predicted transcriptional regulator